MSKKTTNVNAALSDESRAEALETFLGQINKEKPNAVLRLNESTKVVIDVVPTGAISLDVAIGAGGFPRGKIIELYGPEGAGKTTVALTVAANVQKLGGTIGFIDAEHGLNRQLCDNIGIDPSRFIIFQPDSGEEAIEMVEKMIRSKAFDMVIVDSVAAMTPKAEIDSEVEQQFMGLHARLMSRFMRRVAAISNEHDVMLVLLNQVRKNLGAYGTPDETTGGKAIKFYSSLRIEVRTSGSKKITKGTEVLGHTIAATVKKNRLGPPHTTAEFDIIYGKGVDGTGAIIDVAEKLGVLSRAGAYYTEVLTGEKLSEEDETGKLKSVMGKESVKELFRRNTVLRDRIVDSIYAALEVNTLEKKDSTNEEPALETEDTSDTI